MRRNLKGYLATRVANRARDQLRTKRARPQAPAAELEAVVAADPEPATPLLENEEVQRLYQALTQLVPEQREVIVLRLQGTMSFRQIARQQGVSINTAQSRYRYGLKKLRSLLDEDYDR